MSPLTVFTRARPLPPASSTRPSIVSAVTSAGVPTTWIAPATLLRSSVPSTPTTSMSADADFTHTRAPRGTCTSSSARPVTTTLRTLAVPAAASRPGPCPDTARLSTSHPITRIRPEGLTMRTDPSPANGQRSSNPVRPAGAWPRAPRAANASPSPNPSQTMYRVTSPLMLSWRSPRGLPSAAARPFRAPPTPPDRAAPRSPDHGPMRRVTHGSPRRSRRDCARAGRRSPA